MSDLRGSFEKAGYQESQEQQRLLGLLKQPGTEFRLSADYSNEEEGLNPDSEQYLTELENNWQYYKESTKKSNVSDNDFEKHELTALTREQVEQKLNKWIESATEPEYKRSLISYKERFLSRFDKYERAQRDTRELLETPVEESSILYHEFANEYIENKNGVQGRFSNIQDFLWHRLGEIEDGKRPLPVGCKEVSDLFEPYKEVAELKIEPGELHRGDAKSRKENRWELTPEHLKSPELQKKRELFLRIIEEDTPSWRDALSSPQRFAHYVNYSGLTVPETFYILGEEILGDSYYDQNSDQQSSRQHVYEDYKSFLNMGRDNIRRALKGRIELSEEDAKNKPRLLRNFLLNYVKEQDGQDLMAEIGDQMPKVSAKPVELVKEPEQRAEAVARKGDLDIEKLLARMRKRIAKYPNPEPDVEEEVGII